MNQTLHALLHAGTRWWHELVVVNLDGTSGYLVETLKGYTSETVLGRLATNYTWLIMFNDSLISWTRQRYLSKQSPFLPTGTSNSTCRKVSLGRSRNRIWPYLVILIIGGHFAQIPLDTTSSYHDTAKRVC